MPRTWPQRGHKKNAYAADGMNMKVIFSLKFGYAGEHLEEGDHGQQVQQAHLEEGPARLFRRLRLEAVEGAQPEQRGRGGGQHEHVAVRDPAPVPEEGVAKNRVHPGLNHGRGLRPHVVVGTEHPEVGALVVLAVQL